MTRSDGPRTGGAKTTGSWDELEGRLKGSKKSSVATAKQLAEAAKSIGLAALPPSYCEFAQRIGYWGEWQRAGRHARFPRFLNIHKPSDLRGRREMFVQRMDASSEISENAHSLSQALWELRPFATDASGTDACWDPDMQKEDGELGICFIDRQAPWKNVESVRTDCGPYLLDVLQYYKPR